MEANLINHLDDLKVGDVYFMTQKVRLCRVEEVGNKIYVYNSLTKQREAQPACKILTIIPIHPIPDLINDLQAKMNRVVASALAKVLELEEAETGNKYIGGARWHEIWAEREAYELKKGNKGYMERDPRRPIREVYVSEVTGLPDKTVGCSGFLNRSVCAIKIDAPDSWFETLEPEEPEEEQLEDIDPKGRGNFLKLRSIAGKRNVDISDIHGEGATERIKERLLKEETSIPVTG